MNSQKQRLALIFICVSYIVLASIYSVVVPIFEASDELWHYPMVKYLADNGLQLPPQDPANPGAWRQEGSQPPLYYMLAAILTAGIDTSDMDYVRRINPHADIGVVRPDGNANMIVHRIEAEAFPWRGTVLAVHVARFFSIALGLGTVIVTYQLAREIFPDEPALQLSAAALVAFLPMFLFISGSVNNDNLSNLLGNLLTLLIVRLLKMTQRPHWRVYVILGIVTGAGLLAKFNIGFLLPIVALALLILSVRLRDWRPVVIGGAISGTLTIVIAGWWYWRNIQLYGDSTGLNRFLEMVGRRAVPANVAQLWSERHSFTQSFWGFFGGMNVPMPEWIYLIFNIIGGIGLLGALIFIIYRLVKRTGLSLPMLVTLIWPVISFISYLRWTAETPASQGRLMFGALSSIMLWMAVGLTWWPLGRFKRIPIRLAIDYFVVIAAITPIWLIQTYAVPDGFATFTDEDNPFVFAEPNGEGRIEKFEIASPDTSCRGIFSFRPEEYVCIQMGWIMRHPTEQDWTLFVHLVSPDGVIVGQRDIYPAGGKMATSDLQRNRVWGEQIAVWIPATAYAPQKLEIRYGWYNQQTGERMHLQNGDETIRNSEIDLVPRKSDLDVPNPISVNFGGLVELVGYSLTDLSPNAGDTIELTLYWRGLQTIPDDYKVFANIIDPRTLTKYAASDSMPVQWTRPTTTWTPGEIIEDTHTLNVSADSPPGIYELELGLYREAPDSSFPRLRIFTLDGGQSDNFIYLSRVRILPASNEEGS